MNRPRWMVYTRYLGRPAHISGTVDSGDTLSADVTLGPFGAAIVDRHVSKPSIPAKLRVLNSPSSRRVG